MFFQRLINNKLQGFDLFRKVHVRQYCYNVGYIMGKWHRMGLERCPKLRYLRISWAKLRSCLSVFSIIKNVKEFRAEEPYN